MKRLFFIIYLLIFSVITGCSASFPSVFPSVLLPERLDYSPVKRSEKITADKTKKTDTETTEIPANQEWEQTPADVFADSVFAGNGTAMFPFNQAQYQTAPQFTQQQYVQHIPQPQVPPLLPPQVAETIDEDIESVLKPQRGDSRRLQNLLADIIATPQEEWKISERKLAERLTVFRQTMKNERNPELETLYLKQLRSAILPGELPDNADSDTAAEIAAKESNEDKTKNTTEKEIPPKKTAPEPKYGQLAQINDTAKPPADERNIVPVSYRTTDSSTNAPQPLPSYSSEYSTNRWEQQVRIGTDMLRREIEQTPSGRTFENEIKLRLLEQVLGNRNEAVSPFTTEDRRFSDAWNNMMLGIAALSDSAAIPDRKNRIMSAAFRFEECSTAMNQFCPIRLRNYQLVKSWLGFGAFEPKEDVCVSGEEVGVYLELENPVIKRSAKGYNVSVAITYEIRDMTANIIERSDKIHAEDTAPSLRRDHCIHFKVFLPKTLPQGQYQLRVNVTDMNSDSMQYAEEQIPLRVRTGMPLEQAR
ncbi:MAG: hypothetical protein FWE67_01800 [Planctomycetaceae bacterium]|nr:hypothetical protein [Planctomycetaceae bacterium]